MIPDRTKALVSALTKLVPDDGDLQLADLQDAVSALNPTTRAELLKYGAVPPTTRTDALVAALARAPAAFDQLSAADKDAVWNYVIYSLILPPGARTAEEMFGPDV